MATAMMAADIYDDDKLTEATEAAVRALRQSLRGGQERQAEPDPEAAPLKFSRFSAAQPNLDAADFVEGLLIEGAMSVVYGESNSGKTFFATDLALHVALGREWNGRAVDRGGVLYLALEGRHGINNRVAAFRAHYGLDRVEIPFAFSTEHADLHEATVGRDRIIATVNALAATVPGTSVRLIIVDTLSRAMAGGNENSPEDMGALVANGDVIRNHTGAHVMWVHHSGKDTAKGARGHSLLRAATDTEIEIVNDGGTRSARVTKQRDLECSGEWSFSLKAVELGTNRRGKSVTSCVVDVAIDAPGGAPRRPRLTGHKQRALEVLADLIAESGRSGDAGTPSGYLSVPDKWWRERFYDRAMPGAEPDARQKAFRRAADELVAMGAVGMASGRVWLVWGAS